MKVLKIQGLILRTNEAANWQKTMRSQLNLKFIGSSKKSVTWIKVSLLCLCEYACIDFYLLIFVTFEAQLMTAN